MKRSKKSMLGTTTHHEASLVVLTRSASRARYPRQLAQGEGRPGVIWNPSGIRPPRPSTAFAIVHPLSLFLDRPRSEAVSGRWGAWAARAVVIFDTEEVPRFKSPCTPKRQDPISK